MSLLGNEEKELGVSLGEVISPVFFDSNSCMRNIWGLTLELDGIDSMLRPLLPRIPKQSGVEVRNPFKKNGWPTKMVNDWWYLCRVDDARHITGGAFTRIEYTRCDLNSDKQTKEWLLSIGWIPDEYNTSKKTGEITSPKLTPSSFSSLPNSDIGLLIKRRVIIRHRRSQMVGWIKNLRFNHTIGAGANTIGTPTARFRHRGVVNVPKVTTYPKDHPKVGELVWSDDPEYQKKIPYGTEMRSFFTVPENYVMVGHDASGIELRMLAHYMNDKEYTEILLNGDIHSHNQKLAGLPTRDAAKTFIYAFNYGAGNLKLGSIIEGGANEGAKLRSRFLSENPALKKLIKRVKRAATRGYLNGFDGRRILMRRNEDGRIQTHKALNTLLQSAGSIVMKWSMVWLDKAWRAEGLRVKKVIDMHDESQAQVHVEDAERFAELAEQSLVEAGIHFKLNCPLAAEAKIGRNWAETH